MNSPSASRQRFVKLGLLALFCAVPFLGAIVYFERQVERIDTLPVDEYKELTWAADGQSLLFLHRPLVDGAQSELWSQDTGTSQFSSLGLLPAGKTWRLTGQKVDESVVVAGSVDGVESLGLVGQSASALKVLEVEPSWEMLRSQGQGLFYASVVNDLPFDRFVDVEDAPGVSGPQSGSDPPSDPEPGATPGGPTRTGLQVGRYSAADRKVDVLLSIPFSGPEQQPKVLLLRESPDKRFLALVIAFGEAGTGGLWVYDSEASRLLWTRIVVDADLHGMDWSQSSTGVALSDSQGVVVLDNVLGIESTRYQAQGLGALEPYFVDQDNLFLASPTALFRLDRQAGQAEMVFDSRAKGGEVSEFVVNESASKVAYFASLHGYLELMVDDLRTPEEAATESRLPGSLRREAQGTLTYQVGDAIRTAWHYWIGQPSGEGS